MARRDSSAKPQTKDTVTLGIFARRLGESMTARRLSALQVAEGAGVDERTISLWLAAEVEPQLFRADQAAQLLGTSLDTLLGSPPYSTPPRPASDIASLFGRRLEAQILRSGRETTEVAERAQVARNSLNRWKAGTAEPRRLAGRQGARGGARCPPRLPAAPTDQQASGGDADVGGGVTWYIKARKLRS
jgi:transcriptional regulator with XRE-family HTH domain